MKLILSIWLVMLAAVRPAELPDTTLPGTPIPVEVLQPRISLTNYTLEVRVPYHTNEIPEVQSTVERELSTNWLDMALAVPNGDGSNQSKPWQVGVVLSNRYARVVTAQSTNRVLLSSQVIGTPSPLLREPSLHWSMKMTNVWLTNLPPGSIRIWN